jgi:hypothetical protein
MTCAALVGGFTFPDPVLRADPPGVAEAARQVEAAAARDGPERTAKLLAGAVTRTEC